MPPAPLLGLGGLHLSHAQTVRATLTHITLRLVMLHNWLCLILS